MKKTESAHRADTIKAIMFAVIFFSIIALVSYLAWNTK